MIAHVEDCVTLELIKIYENNCLMGKFLICVIFFLSLEEFSRKCFFWNHLITFLNDKLYSQTKVLAKKIPFSKIPEGEAQKPTIFGIFASNSTFWSIAPKVLILATWLAQPF